MTPNPLDTDLEMSDEDIAEIEEMFEDATAIAMEYYNKAIADHEEQADVIALSFIEVALNMAAELTQPEVVVEIVEDLLEQMRADLAANPTEMN